MCIFKFNTCFFPKGPGKGTDEGTPMETYSGDNGDCFGRDFMGAFSITKMNKSLIHFGCYKWKFAFNGPANEISKIKLRHTIC